MVIIKVPLAIFCAQHYDNTLPSGEAPSVIVACFYEATTTKGSDCIVLCSDACTTCLRTWIVTFVALFAEIAPKTLLKCRQRSHNRFTIKCAEIIYSANDLAVKTLPCCVCGATVVEQPCTIPAKHY